MKRVLSVILLLLLSATFAVAGEPVIDGSTPEVFKDSFVTMASGNGKEASGEFMKAYMKIAKSLDLGTLRSQEEAQRKSLEAMSKKLDGKTFAQIIAMAKELPDDPELERMIADMKKMGTSSAYQHDADITRLKHLRYLGGLIEEYKIMTGRYPLVKNSHTENYVYIANSGQVEYARSGAPSYKHTETGAAEFKKILEKGLKRKVVLPFDPQTVAVNKPNFYTYMTRGDRYFLAVHLHDGEGLGRKVAPYYYKAEVSNVAMKKYGIVTYKELIADKTFIKRVTEEYSKRGPRSPEQGQ